MLSVTATAGRTRRCCATALLCLVPTVAVCRLVIYLGSTPPQPPDPGGTLYANPATGEDTFDGLRPECADGHGPKQTIAAAIAAAADTHAIQAAGGSYDEPPAWPLDHKAIRLTPLGSVTVR